MKRHSANLTINMKKKADKDEPLDLKEWEHWHLLHNTTTYSINVDLFQKMYSKLI